METSHRVYVGDSRDMGRIPDDSVELVITSPPYPMIEMWDDLFATLDPRVEQSLDAGDGRTTFERMHTVLDDVWDEVSRVLVDGGIACVNVGDATRKVGGSFRVYQNHSRVVTAFEERGFDPLPDVLWRKPANSGAKFMGSGMVPPNAYVTLEHEYVLVFRNGPDRRAFEPHADRRYQAAYFWEERNEWFSDIWTDVRGTVQTLDDAATRDRSAAYPFEIPYRLINMYSVYGDTVLDPFWGTGTTTLAAMVAGRNSVGHEQSDGFEDLFAERLSNLQELSREVVTDRVDDHEDFVERRSADGVTFEYDAEHYDFAVTTKQEQPIRLYTVSDIESRGHEYVVAHEPMTRD